MHRYLETASSLVPSATSRNGELGEVMVRPAWRVIKARSATTLLSIITPAHQRVVMWLDRRSEELRVKRSRVAAEKRQAFKQKDMGKLGDDAGVAFLFCFQRPFANVQDKTQVVGYFAFWISKTVPDEDLKFFNVQLPQARLKRQL